MFCIERGQYGPSCRSIAQRLTTSSELEEEPFEIWGLRPAETVGRFRRVTMEKNHSLPDPSSLHSIPPGKLPFQGVSREAMPFSSKAISLAKVNAPRSDMIAGWARGRRTLGCETRSEKMAGQRWHQGDLFHELVDQGVWEVQSLPMEFEQETRCKERAKPTATSTRCIRRGAQQSSLPRTCQDDSSRGGAC